MSLCDYSDALGLPNEGVHSVRVAGLAAIDLFLTAGVSYLVVKDSSYPLVAFMIVFIVLILMAIVVHKAFCVDTALNKMIFGKSAKK